MNAYHIRVLCDNPWDGGGGYTPEQVGRMTLDQIWSRLCKVEILRRKVGNKKVSVAADELHFEITPDEEGFVKVRTSSGKVVKMKCTNKSVVQQLMEQQKSKKGKHRRKNRR